MAVTQGLNVENCAGALIVYNCQSGALIVYDAKDLVPVVEAGTYTCRLQLDPKTKS